VEQGITDANRMEDTSLLNEDRLSGVEKRLEMLGVQLEEISTAVQGKAVGVSEGDDNEDRKRLKEKLVKVLHRVRFDMCKGGWVVNRVRCRNGSVSV
jgi:hypothetical protein